MKLVKLAIAAMVAGGVLSTGLARGGDQTKPLSGITLPEGHPDISAAASRPAQQAGPRVGSVTIKAIQGTEGGPRVGADAATVELYVRGQLLDKIETKLEANGTKLVKDVPVGLSPVPVVRIVHAGVEYIGEGAPMQGTTASQTIEVPVYETSEQAPPWQIKMRHVMVHPGEGGLHVMEMVAVENPADRAWVAPTTITLPLPAAATDVTVVNGMSESAAKIEPGRLISAAPVSPGETQYQIGYTLPAQEGKAQITVSSPVTVKHLMVFVPDDGTIVTAPGLEAGGSMEMDLGGGEGRTRFYRAMDVAAGKELKVTVAGLGALADSAGGPAKKAEASGSAQAAQVVAGVGALVIVLFGAAFVFTKAGRKA